MTSLCFLGKMVIIAFKDTYAELAAAAAVRPNMMKVTRRFHKSQRIQQWPQLWTKTTLATQKTKTALTQACSAGTAHSHAQHQRQQTS